MENIAKQRVAVRIINLLSGFCASILMLWVIKQGPGVGPDSTVFFESARSLLLGDGLSVRGKPMTHFPPLYSVLLSIFSFFQDGDILQTARLLCAFFFGVNLVLFVSAVQMCSDYSVSSTVCAILFFLCSESILVIHSMALSEGPFLTFSLSAFIMLSMYCARPSLKRLLMTAFLTSLAILTRYAGVALLSPMAVALFLFGDRSMRCKLKNILLFITVSITPLILCLVYNFNTAQTGTNRSFVFHPINFEHLRSLIKTIHNFILPLHFSFGAKLFLVCVAVIFLLVGAFVIYRKTDCKSGFSSSIALSSLCYLFFLLYVPFVLFSISFFDAHTPLNSRILLPSLLALIITGVSLAWYLSRRLEQKPIWYVFVFLMFSSIAFNGYQTIPRGLSLHKKGYGYTSQNWKKSHTISYFENTSEHREIYSNGSDVIRFLTGKKAFMVPQKFSPTTRKKNRNYEDEINQALVRCKKGEVVIVYFYKIGWRDYLPSVWEIEAKEALPVLRQFDDGIIYGTEPVDNTLGSPSISENVRFEIYENMILYAWQSRCGIIRLGLENSHLMDGAKPTLLAFPMCAAISPSPPVSFSAVLPAIARFHAVA